MNQQELEQLLSDVRDIKRALTGNKTWGDKGLIQDVQDLKSWKQSVVLKVAFYSGVFTTLAFAANKAFEWLSLRH